MKLIVAYWMAAYVNLVWFGVGEVAGQDAGTKGVLDS
jgi:hypothetical protein